MFIKVFLQTKIVYQATMIEPQSKNQAYQPIIFNIKQDPQPIKVVSLCVDCGNNGQTILLMTKIPFFKQLLITSFACEDCGNKNNEIQFVGQLPPRGINIKFNVTEPADLNREIIRSEHASIKFEELGLQIPQAKRAEITTIQGLLKKVKADLSYGQQDRRYTDHESYQKIGEFLKKINEFKEGKVLPFTVNVYDPSGNSNIKNPFAPKLDSRLFISYFTRSVEQLTKMGYKQQNIVQTKNEQQQTTKNNQQQDGTIKKVDFTKPVGDKDFMHNELSVLQIDCHACNMPGQMRICATDIPHFTDLIIMSFTCDYCGAHNTQTKTSGVITDKSTTITLTVKDALDLKRDLFKSQTCGVKIPQIELELDYGTLGGVFTTVQGLLQKITNHMKQINPFTDSDDDFSKRMLGIIASLQNMRSGAKEFIMILEDPLSNSFLQNPFHPEVDKHAIRVQRERTEDEKDYLGINQMSV